MLKGSKKNEEKKRVFAWVIDFLVGQKWPKKCKIAQKDLPFIFFFWPQQHHNQPLIHTFRISVRWEQERWKKSELPSIFNGKKFLNLHSYLPSTFIFEPDSLNNQPVSYSIGREVIQEKKKRKESVWETLFSTAGASYLPPWWFFTSVAWSMSIIDCACYWLLRARFFFIFMLFFCRMICTR